MIIKRIHNNNLHRKTNAFHRHISTIINSTTIILLANVFCSCSQNDAHIENKQPAASEDSYLTNISNDTITYNSSFVIKIFKRNKDIASFIRKNQPAKDIYFDYSFDNNINGEVLSDSKDVLTIECTPTATLTDSITKVKGYYRIGIDNSDIRPGVDTFMIIIDAFYLKKQLPPLSNR
ncbi:hypothetical protein K3G63_02860 [Hymenobacter sp. HSC-4F20]|uniref:hypothetical protein n=1 Tax=Hymenobacter sp. HSC-4F20 TaxID=2864135 RepID=UPI001C739FFB|nr:hypothetical protein [Hymenobacter sp. HSC-4F20]MBX0289360.1 hypothetical protein [Hymenobacter sp. HSC-4F20]